MRTGDLVVLFAQGEMADIEQVNFGMRQIALERLCTGCDERGIFPPPNHQSGRHDNQRLAQPQPSEKLPLS
jgi:hypothetical protein